MAEVLDVYVLCMTENCETRALSAAEQQQKYTFKLTYAKIIIKLGLLLSDEATEMPTSSCTSRLAVYRPV